MLEPSKQNPTLLLPLLLSPLLLLPLLLLPMLLVPTLLQPTFPQPPVLLNLNTANARLTHHCRDSNVSYTSQLQLWQRKAKLHCDRYRNDGAAEVVTHPKLPDGHPEPAVMSIGQSARSLRMSAYKPNQAQILKTEMWLSKDRQLHCAYLQGWWQSRRSFPSPEHRGRPTRLQRVQGRGRQPVLLPQQVRQLELELLTGLRACGGWGQGQQHMKTRNPAKLTLYRQQTHDERQHLPGAGAGAGAGPIRSVAADAKHTKPSKATIAAVLISLRSSEAERREWLPASNNTCNG